MLWGSALTEGMICIELTCQYATEPFLEHVQILKDIKERFAGKTDGACPLMTHLGS